MNIFNKVVGLLLFVLIVASTPAFAQTAITRTTLSAAVAPGASRILVASATGFSASGSKNTYIAYIDNQAYKVTSVSGTTIGVTSTNGYPTPDTKHASGALVFFGPAGGVDNNYSSPFVQNEPSGACSRATMGYAPIIVPRTGGWFDCHGGAWIEQTAPRLVSLPAVPTLACSAPLGSVAYGSVGTSTTFVAGTIYQSSIFVPRTFIATGVRVLQNGTVATDKLIGALADIDGTQLVSSAVAGTTTSGANTLLALAFTATTLVTGPAYYVIQAQGNGTTDGIRTVAASTFVDLNAKSQTGTFGTLPTLTPATSFTANTAPYACLYQ